MEALDLDRSKVFPIRVRRGQSIDQTIQVKNLDGTAFDFTGYSAELLAYTSFAKTDLTPEFEIDVALAIGSMRLTSDPINRKREDFIYILWMTDNTGLRQPWTNGPFMILNRQWTVPDDDETFTISPEGSPIVFYISPIGLTDDPDELPDPITSAAIITALGYVPANAATLTAETNARIAEDDAINARIDTIGSDISVPQAQNMLTTMIANLTQTQIDALRAALA